MTLFSSLKRKLVKAIKDPAIIRRRIQQRIRERRLDRAIRHAERRLHDAIRDAEPLPIDVEGPVELRVLCGHGRVVELAGMLRSFYRFAPRFPALVHDDGTLQPSDCEFLTRHFPNLRILLRPEADAVMRRELGARGLSRCLGLREANVFGLKLLDIPYFGRGKRILYLDSDVLVQRRPDALLEALNAPDDEWVDRYNEDVKSSYVWTDEMVREHAGLVPLPKVNSGMLCLRIDELEWELFERCLQLPDWGWWAEQNLYAIYLTRRGARPLPSEYDVCFRHAWEGEERSTCLAERKPGRPVVSQHFCGGKEYRVLFHEALLDSLSPTPIRSQLGSSSEAAPAGIA
jgi:hypothetical protein